METERFDALTRRLGNATSRRVALKGVLGIGAAAVGLTGRSLDAGAARRGFSGPKLPTQTPCTSACSSSCPCGPDRTCIGGVCFQPCIGCGCDSCTIVVGLGSFCVEDVYATSGSCVGICDAGYGCNGDNLCMKPCSI